MSPAHWRGVCQWRAAAVWMARPVTFTWRKATPLGGDGEDCAVMREDDLIWFDMFDVWHCQNVSGSDTQLCL